jgi:LysM repeat protein
VQEFVEKDQLIYIMRKRKFGLNEQHTVKPGETLNDIAQAEALRIESLLEYNFLQPGMQPAVGSILYLRTKGPGMPALANGK